MTAHSVEARALTLRPLVVGHSHTIVFGNPFGKLGKPEIVSAAGGLPFDLLAGPWPRNEAYFQAMTEASTDRDILILWDGNQHQADFMFAPTPAFDFISSSFPELPFDDGVMLVPESMIREFFRRHCEPLRGAIRSIRTRNAACSISVLGTPPPKGDNQRMQAYVATSPYFANLAKKMECDPSTIELSSPSLRLKLWSVLQAVYGQIAVEFGCRFIGVPVSIKDENGYLHPDCWAADLTHANLEYGRRLCDHLVSLGIHLNGSGRPTYASV